MIIISGNIEVHLVSTIILIYNVLLIKYIRKFEVIIVLFYLFLCIQFYLISFSFLAIGRN